MSRRWAPPQAWEDASIGRRIAVVALTLVTAFFALALLVPWFGRIRGTAKGLGTTKPPTTPVRPMGKRRVRAPVGKVHDVFAVFLSSQDSTTAQTLETFIDNITVRDIKLTYSFVDGPPSLKHKSAYVNKYEESMAKNKKRGAMEFNLRRAAMMFDAIDTFLAGSSDFLFIGTDTTFVNPYSFGWMFDQLDPKAKVFKGACLCDKQLAYMTSSGGWIFSRSAAEATKKIDRAVVFSSLDYHWDLVMGNWIASAIEMKVEDTAFNWLASDLIDADVRLIGTDLEFLIPQCEEPGKPSCPCGKTKADLSDVGAWPQADGAALGTPRGRAKADKVEQASQNWKVHSSTGGRTMLCWEPDEFVKKR